MHVHGDVEVFLFGLEQIGPTSPNCIVCFLVPHEILVCQDELRCRTDQTQCVLLAQHADLTLMFTLWPAAQRPLEGGLFDLFETSIS